MRHARQLFLTGMIALSFVCTPLLADQDPDPHATGLRELSPEQIQEFKRKHARVTKVKPNKLGLSRINQHRGKLRMAIISSQIAASDDNDLEFTTGQAAPSGSGLIVNGPFVSSTLSPSGGAALPDSVDNSTLKYFPPIRTQGSLGSCAQFSGVYYTMTYMLAKARDLDAKTGDDSVRLSPKWTYNMLNDGQNVGSWYMDAYEIGMKNGIASWAELPYDSNFRAWSVNPAVWRSAINRKFTNYGYVNDTNTDAGIRLVKQMLVNGYILNFPTYINSWQYKAAGNDPSTAADDAFAGKSVCYFVNGTNGYHAMTVVGYNDNIWVDINNNGSVDSGEKGAFKIANSWGTAWGQAGFAWMAYDSLKNVSAVQGGPSYGRTPGWTPNMAYWVRATSSYTPSLVAEFTLNAARRDQMFVRFGASDLSSSGAATYLTSYMLSYQGGPYSFNGTTTAVDGTFVFDLSDLAPREGSGQSYYLTVNDNALANPTQIKSLKVIEVATGQERYASNLPVSADYSSTTVRVDFSHSAGNFPPAAYYSMDQLTGPAPFTNVFDATRSYDSDGAIVSYLWDFGDGEQGSGPVVSHTFEQAATYRVVLTVMDNYGASASMERLLTVVRPENYLNPPTRLRAAASDHIVTLRWNDNSPNEEGFYISRADATSGGAFRSIGKVGADATSFTDTTAWAGTVWYRIDAYSASAGRSGNSNTVQVKVR